MTQKNILSEFTDLLLAELGARIKATNTTCGFEIEFLPLNAPDLKQMEELRQLLPELGFSKKEDHFFSNNGLLITFEPGGQIEYCSPPLGIDDFELFNKIVNQIAKINAEILNRLGIQYRATGFMPGRADSPLCLQAERYRKLHQRMAFSGTRGREMMKGTASVHLHIGLRSLEEMPLIYRTLCRLSQDDEFAMSRERRHIWNNTDASRCKMPLIDRDRTLEPRRLLYEITHHALCAEDLHENVPVYELNNLTFDYFMVHLTTIFTDVRLNLKGPTLELRTPDSLPLPDFIGKWKLFTSIFEKVLKK